MSLDEEAMTDTTIGQFRTLRRERAERSRHAARNRDIWLRWKAGERRRDLARDNGISRARVDQIIALYTFLASE
jgi:hypothetical protein